MTITSERIKMLREQNGLTQDDVAEALQMRRANVSNYERGIITNIPAEVLNKLADLFKTNVDYLLGRIDDPAPSGYTHLEERNGRDIAYALEQLLLDLESDETLTYHGQKIALDKDTKKLLRLSLEFSIQLLKQATKHKGISKKTQ